MISKENPQCWWVVIRSDNHYPLVIYPDKRYAELVAGPNKQLIIPVITSGEPIIPTNTTNEEFSKIFPIKGICK